MTFPAISYILFGIMQDSTSSLKDNAPTLKSISFKISEKRKQAGLTQNVLAQKLEKSRLFVVEMEGGKKDISLSVIYDLAEVFDCPVTDLLPARKLDRPPVERRGDEISESAQSQVEAILKGIRYGN